MNDLYIVSKFLFWYHSENPKALWGGVYIEDVIDAFCDLENIDREQLKNIIVSNHDKQ